MDKKKISLREIGLPRLIIIFVAGILIILLSFPELFGREKSADNNNSSKNVKVEQKDANTTSYDTNTYISEMENKLKSVLRKVSGIGEVEVMISLKASKKQIPLKDTPTTQESLNEVDGEGGSRTNNNVQMEESTVMYTDEKGETVPYIVQELEPEIEGIIVVAEGGDNPQIKMDIMQAAQVLFDIPAHKVLVMKMESGIK